MCYFLTKNLFYIEDQKFFNLRKQKLSEELEGKRIQNTDKLIIQHFDGMPYQVMAGVNFGETMGLEDIKREDINKFARSIKGEMNISVKDLMKILGNDENEDGVANRFHQEVGIISRDFIPLYLRHRLNENMNNTLQQKEEENSELIKYSTNLSELEALDDITLVNFINQVSSCKVDDEYLSTVLAIEVLRRKEELPMRSLANISNAFARPSRVFQSFVGFYEELKEPISMKLISIIDAKNKGTWTPLDEDYNLDDICGVLTGYSKTYNLTYNFIRILTKAGFEKFKNIKYVDKHSRKKGVTPKSLVTIFHTVSLNRKLVTEVGENGLTVFDSNMRESLGKIETLFYNSYTAFKGFEICVMVKNLMLMDRFNEQTLKILEFNVRTNRENFNITDCMDTLESFLSFIDLNRDKYTEKEMVLKEGVFLQREPNVYDYIKNYQGAKEKMKTFNEDDWENFKLLNESDTESEEQEQEEDKIEINEQNDNQEFEDSSNKFELIENINNENEDGKETEDSPKISFEDSYFLKEDQRMTLDYLIEVLNLLNHNIEKCHVRPILFHINYLVGKY
jgi:hypothetical protein